MNVEDLEKLDCAKDVKIVLVMLVRRVEELEKQISYQREITRRYVQESIKVHEKFLHNEEVPL